MTTASIETKTPSPPENPAAAASPRLALVATPDAATLQPSLDGVRDVLARPEESSELVRLYAADPRAASYRGALLIDGAAGSISLRETSVADGDARPVAFLFPGLGDHYLGMASDLYRRLPVFRQCVDRCAELLQPELGSDLRGVMYPGGAATAAPPAARAGLDLRRMLGRDGRAASPEEARLNQTRFAQPALFTVEYALAEQWRAWGLAPAVMIGYSLGEYVAACLAGVLSLEDSLKLVARRALLIEELPPGAMLAVMLSEAEVGPLLGEHLSISAVNGPAFCVVAGPPEEVQSFEERLRSRGATVRRVQTSHAFHTKMMEPIAEQVTRLAAALPRNAPRIPYVSNVTGERITAAQATDPAYWATHLCKPVRFAAGLGALGATVLVEVGPGQTLSSLATLPGSAPSPAGRTVVASMRHTYDPELDTPVLLKALARVWLGGAAFEPGRLPVADLPAAAGAPSEVEPAAAPVPPSTATERELAGIWQKLLHCEPPSLDANFFRLGGNSLLATRLIDRVHRSLRVKLPLRRVYQEASLGAMAGVIDAIRTGGPQAAARPAAAAAPAPAGQAPSPGKPPFRLPNGLVVSHQNEAETRHFYDDIFAHRSYVRHGIRIPDGGCVLDVGGNIGLFTLFAHTEAKDVRIFTFEPAPPLLEIVRRNVAQHGIRATVFPFGLSNAEREAPFTFYQHSAGMSSFHPDEAEEKHNLKMIMENQRRGGAAEVDQVASYAEELLDVRFAATTYQARLRRLSDVLREERIEHIDLMKVDVQKCEMEVIEGIDDADWPKFSQIVLEAHDVDGRVAQLVTLFERRGFRVIAEQDDLYVGTNIHNIYAIREGK